MAYGRNELVSREIKNPHAENRGVWISATGISTRVLLPPTPAPSVFTTPAVVMSPRARVPVPMMDSPASLSGTPWPFSVKIAMSILLFHDGEGIERLALATDYEVEVRRRGPSRAAREGDHLSRSEEHTSELQSRLHLVCRLLLEKKKNN